MQILLVYDIADDTRRQRLVKILLDYGQRVQESVFWIDAEEELTARMERRIRAAVDPESDSVWIVPLCANCAAKITTIGISRRPALPEYYIV